MKRRPPESTLTVSLFPHTSLVRSARHGAALAPQELLDRAAVAGIGQPMGAVGGRRQVAALDLVLALGTGLDAREAVGDGIVDGLVVAGLEVQEAEAPERSEEHTSELQSLMRISYTVFCLKKK